MEEVEIKIRLPKDDEIIGVVEEKLGGAHFRVYCMDEKTRLCRIPGAKKRGLWIELNRVVLVKPWEVQSDDRGDIIAKYDNHGVKELTKKGLYK